MLKFPNKKGQAMVEFALMAPLFVLLLFSIIEWGMYFYSALILQNAVQDATRYAVTVPDWKTNSSDREDEIEAFIQGRCALIPSITSGQIATALTVTYLPTLSGLEYIQIDVSDLPFEKIGPAGLTLPDNMNATATMRWERKN